MAQAVAQVSRLQPDTGEDWLAQGYYRYRGLRDYAGALDAFQKASARLPNNAETLMAMALVERRHGDMSSALAHIALAEQFDPRNPQYMQVKSEFLLGLRRFPEARAAIDRSLELLPGDTSQLAAKIGSYQSEGDLAAAQRLVDTPPADDPEDLFTAARITQDWWTGRFDDAIASCRALIQAEINPYGRTLGFDCQFSIAIAQRLRGDAAAAATTCEGLLKRLDRPDSAALDASSRAAYRGLAKACMGRKAQALQDLQTAIDIEQGDTRNVPMYMVSIAMVHAQFGEVDAAVAILKQSLQVPYGVTVGQLRFDPVWSSIRQDPRFQALLLTPG
jgi:tetratricopeptide (TPR) repeat protein